jgi:dihydroflavonol-4-reductase
MKVLVTGATGLLGANLVRELETRGMAVRVLVRRNSDLRVLDGTLAERVVGDILDAASLHRAVDGCQAVIHSAACTTQWPTAFRYYEEINVTGTQRVMEACRKKEVSRIVYVSSANAFGPGSLEQPGTELSEFSLFRSGSGYIVSKYLAQQKVLWEVERTRLPAVVVNPTFMIGPYDSRPGCGQIVLMGARARRHWIPPGGKNFVPVRDVAIGICQALEKGRIGECYLLAGENHTYEEFFQIIDHVLHRNPAKIRIPAAALTTAGLVGTIIERLTGTTPRLNYVNANLLSKGYYYSPRKAMTELQMPRTSLELAVREALEWFRKVGRFP